MTTASAIEVGSHNSAVPVTLEHFRRLFNELDKGNLNRLSEVYSEDISFRDPLGSAKGLDELTQYFAEAYANAISCRFEFSDSVVNGAFAAIPWVMYLRHKRINRGREIQVDGISHLRVADGKVCYHRDYFDAGQLLYENLPLVGRVIRLVKGYAG
ncbi:nuclear transport factor 2 family protein [Marinobacter sp. F4206]|uniref:nuclear transport factor 2 family protein n=1 Tax=Marinobacter sp. F4206 TaxID=2861777 RepID=UPI001C5D446D|nr:nuclear transport factor 2 family protein [Marinobacter sp. F4206]MBW4933256.1 nuclear transport factor 2 family protein [Marinobacter sp. F4206]